MRRGITVAVAVAVAVSFAACSAPPATASESSAIINGVSDSDDPAIVLVLARVPGMTTASLCTGEIISPHVVLTAAHCVDPAEVGAGAKFVVFVGQELSKTSPNSDFLSVSETHLDSAFDKMNPQNGHDVGVVILTTPTTITPVRYNRSAIAAAMVGSAARLVGYGITNANDTAGTSAGMRRQAPTTLAHLDDLFVGLQDGSHGICEGDSGGPALMTIDGVERIVGVTSFGFQGCPLTPPSGTPSGYQAGNDTRLDTYADFIDQWVLQFDCVQTSNGKICGACDPAMPSPCPAGATCTSVDGANVCVAAPAGGGSKKGGGCAVSGRAPVGGVGLLLLAALTLAARRRRARA